MKYLNALTTVAALLIASIVVYAADPTIESCKQIVSSQQVFECSIYEKGRADKALNDQYHSLLKRVGRQYKSNKTLGDDYIQKIKESQRSWIKLRDADCALETFQIEIGTQVYETTLNNCIARKSDERSKYLEHIAPDLY
jgi:uncharacterized protein YecT (DUF1311 family)